MAERIVSGQELGKLLVDALGLDGRLVRRIVVDADCRRAAEVTVYAYATDGSARVAAESVKRYRLVEDAPEGAEG